MINLRARRGDEDVGRSQTWCPLFPQAEPLVERPVRVVDQAGASQPEVALPDLLELAAGLVVAEDWIVQVGNQHDGVPPDLVHAPKLQSVATGLVGQVIAACAGMGGLSPC